MPFGELTCEKRFFAGDGLHELPQQSVQGGPVVAVAVFAVECGIVGKARYEDSQAPRGDIPAEPVGDGVTAVVRA